MIRQKVILRCLDGRLIKGYINDFSADRDRIDFEDSSGRKQEFGVDELKAVFFVRTFEGNRRRAESKVFVDPASLGKRVFVKFKDGESMTGYIEGGVPWKKGFFLEPSRGPGFFLIPVDKGSNNIKVFVVASSVWEVTVMG